MPLMGWKVVNHCRSNEQLKPIMKKDPALAEELLAGQEQDISCH